MLGTTRNTKKESAGSETNTLSRLNSYRNPYRLFRSWCWLNKQPFATKTALEFDLRFI